MGRVVLIPFVLFFIDNFNPLRTFIASLLWLVAAAGDFLDGYLARSRGQVSMLGKFLDPLADKLIVNAVLVYMVALGRVPAWVVVVLIGRDLAVNGLRSIASAQGLVIAASDGGKIKTALQLVAIMLLLIHFRYPALGVGIPVDYHIAGLWLLYVSTVVSLYSGGAVHAALPVGGAQAVARDDVIAVPAAPLPPDEAARRAAARAGRVLAVGAGGRRGRRRARSGRGGARAGRARRRPADLARVERAWAEARAALGARRARRRRPASRRRSAGSRTISGARSSACRRAPAAEPAWPLASRFTSTTRSGCARRAATRRSSRRTRRRRGGSRIALARPARRRRRSALGALTADHPDDACFSTASSACSNICARATPTR